VQAEDWDIYITVDNQYDIYFGTPTTTNFYAGGDTTWTTREYYQALGRLSTDYLYVATASDFSGAQGFLGTFTNTTTGNTISTGNSQWEVFPAGAYAATNPNWPLPWAPSVMPTQTQVDTAIAYAESNSLWVTPTSSPGYDNDLSTPIAPYTWEWGWTFADIEPSASWIWYDSGNDTYAGTFRPVPIIGFNHDEFLIFRLAGAAVPEPGSAVLALLGMSVLGFTPRRRKRLTSAAKA
jgi:hypothetical protein